MASRYAYLSLDGPWTIEGMEFEEGLARRAYDPTYQPRNPVPAKVPCIVQAALFEAGLVEDPYFEMNAEKLLWVEDKEWWFFKEFTVPEEVAGRKYELVFEGITYRANVWLNGISLGHLEGMFLRHRLDVTRLIVPGQKNVLVLRLRALEHSSEDRPGGKIKRGMVRSSGVVAPFTYWWNWAPHIVPIGIWKSVWLRITGGASIQDPFVRTKIEWDECEEAARAEVRIGLEVESSFVGQERVRILGRITGVDFTCPAIEFKRDLILSPGSIQVELETAIERPKLWWPNGMGPHHLYRLELMLLDEERDVLDRVETEFAVRELTMVKNQDDLWVQEVHGQSNRLWSIVGNPYPWTFCINRQRFFVRGTNWLPPDSLFRFSEERYRLFLDQVEEANLNMVRVWGGGIQETETFYRLCDRKGILTWTEFWLACASYPVMPHALFLQCAVDMIKSLRNHPCIALWCGGNEYNPDEPENKELVDKLAEVCREHDPTRPFRRGSPYKGDRHGGLLMLPTRTSNKYNGDILNGDQRLVLFRSEVAVMRSAPLLESIQKFIGSDKIWPIDKPTWEYHHAVIKEQERDAREYGGLDDLDHWVMSGQIAHGQVHRHNLEYCRRTKYWCSGCLQWQLNGSWPSFHRELIDWYGVPKPAFYAYKRAAQDVIVVADMEKYVFDGNEEFCADIYAVNDKRLRLGACRVRAVIYDREMRLRHEQEATVAVEADASVKAFTLRWRVPRDYLRKVFFLHLELSQYDEVLAENFYWIGTSAYVRPDEILNLNGYWQFQVGREKKETRWQRTILPAYWCKPPAAPPEGESVFYRKKVKIPAEWEGTPLEVFCAGFEGNDEVFWNGHRIGGTEEEVTVEIGTDHLIFSEGWTERMAVEGDRPREWVNSPPSSERVRRNIRISSDPFVVPNLIKRFYPIPADLIHWGTENLLEIRLYGEYATGISEPVFIRRASTEAEQHSIVAFDDEGAYLADLRDLPEADLEVEVFHDELRLGPGEQGLIHLFLRNIGSGLAFFIGLSLRGLEDAASHFFSDNYFTLLPGQEKTVRIKLVNDRSRPGSYKVWFEIGGWNLAKRRVGPVLELILD